MFSARNGPVIPRLSPFVIKAGVPYRQVDGVEALDDRHFPDADIVVATFWRTAYWVNGLSPSKGAKAYFVQHGVFPDDDGDPLCASYRLPLSMITISKSLRDVLEQRFGASDVPVIYNSVDGDLFNAPPRIRNKQFNIGFLYSPAPKKGVADCLGAIRKAAIPGARLVSFGAAPPTADLPLPDGASFTLAPEQSMIKSIYGQCDVWLCASHAEGFHLPPLEAMACRCPVVSTKVGGPLDIIRDGENGFLADVGDTETLAGHLTEVAALSADRWQAMSDAAYETAHSYSWDDAAARFERELQRIVDAKAHASWTTTAAALSP
jgi:glycosyltransferase involved in cell wall biosynthesis